MTTSDIQKMIAVGLIWGTTNSFMKKGALIWEHKSLSSSPSKHTPTTTTTTTTTSFTTKLIPSLTNHLNLILTWQYSFPLLVNLLASASFFVILGQTPISVAVPVTNATTFAATALVGFLLGEDMHLGFALFGTFLIVLGVWVCVS